MNLENIDSHILIIHDQPEPRQFLLKSATYSIGRDKHNSIVIPNRAISRQHALLLRMPLPNRAGYRYRILDGNASGQPSLNGISVNGIECTHTDLIPGDIILIGGTIQIEYQVLSIPSSGKYFDYLKIQDPTYQSIKAKPINPSETFVNIEEFQVSALLNSEHNLLVMDDFEDDTPATELFNSRV
ncbi:FHA domain-containing protein [Altericista sp. CCNU0014]|uniref:FHA domain-containing protein n=1 Tax=Altericista sp. CCNU0014 TaxID=3082949 RepID=UPI003850FB91